MSGSYPDNPGASPGLTTIPGQFNPISRFRGGVLSRKQIAAQAQTEERNRAKVEGEGSSPSGRSIIFSPLV